METDTQPAFIEQGKLEPSSEEIQREKKLQEMLNPTFRDHLINVLSYIAMAAADIILSFSAYRSLIEHNMNNFILQGTASLVFLGITAMLIIHNYYPDRTYKDIN